MRLSLGIQRIILEIYPATVANAISGLDSDRSPVTTIFGEIGAKMVCEIALSTLYSVFHCPRACNSVVHFQYSTHPKINNAMFNHLPYSILNNKINNLLLKYFKDKI